MKNKIAFIFLLSMVVLLLAGCGNEPKILYQSSSVEIVREGNRMAVYDLLTGNEYNYTAKRVKRSEGVLEPCTLVDTDTIKIEIIPSGLRVYDKQANKIFECKTRGR